MADLAASDVTMTLGKVRRVVDKREVAVTVAFGDGILTYPSGGAPMPTYSSWGMVRNLEDFIITDGGSAVGYICKYDKTNNKVRVYEQGFRTGSTSASTSASGALIEGGVTGAAETVLRGYGTAIDTTYQLGALKELVGTSKPPEITLIGYAIGY